MSLLRLWIGTTLVAAVLVLTVVLITRSGDDTVAPGFGTPLPTPVTAEPQLGTRLPATP